MFVKSLFRQLRYISIYRLKKRGLKIGSNISKSAEVPIYNSDLNPLKLSEEEKNSN